MMRVTNLLDSPNNKGARSYSSIAREQIVERFRQFIVWSKATEQRFIWIFGILYFGGVCWVLWLVSDFWRYFPSASYWVDFVIFAAFQLVACLVGGYFFGRIMWRKRAIWDKEKTQSK